MSSKSVFDETQGASRISYYQFDPAAIKINADFNGRHDDPNIEWLIQDIVKNGQDTPVIVRKDGEQAVLVAGFSRWRAIIEINKRGLIPTGPLPIKAVYRKCGEVEGFITNIRENRMRNSTTSLDDAHNIARLERYGMAVEAIAAVYHPDLNGDTTKTKKAVAWVRKTSRLATLTPEAEQALKEGAIKPTAAAAISKLADAEQRRLVQEAKGGKIGAAEIRQASGKKAKIGLSEVKRRITAAMDKGSIKGHDIPQFMIDWLEELLKET